MKTRIIANYKQYSIEYNEDNWEMTIVVSNAHDIFNFMRGCHIRDAYNRNNYPLTSHWNRRIDFYKEEYDVCNMGHVHCGDKIKISPPDYYKDGKLMYVEWEKRINRTLTHLRNSAEKAEKERLEKAELERLKSKYEKA